MGLEGFRHARAADACMWPAWYYLSGIVPLASARMLLNEFNARAKIAREAPFDRNVEKQLVFEGFRHAHAAVARMWPAWYYLSRIVPAIARMLLNEFNARAKVSREAPFDRHVEKPLGFQVFSKCARADICNFAMRK